MGFLAPTASVDQPRRGRGFIWAGLLLCLLGLIAAAVQFWLKYLIVPWYSPVLATLGAFLLVLAVVRRRTVVRMLTLVLIVAFAGFQWYALIVQMKLPEYRGPARAGKSLPNFRAEFADGRSFTEADLHDGSRHVLVFFRGRW